MQMRWRWPPENSCGKRLAMSGDKADRLQQLGDPVARLRCGVASLLTSIGSAIAAPTVMRGLRLANGSWKIICMCLRALAQLVPVELQHVLAVEQDRAGYGLDQPHDRAAGGGLAAAGFADKRQRLAGLHAEGDVLDGMHPCR